MRNSLLAACLCLTLIIFFTGCASSPPGPPPKHKPGPPPHGKHWVPGHYAPSGKWVPGHWKYK